MRFLTERQKAMAEAQTALQFAHINHDRQAYLAAIEQEERAKALPELYHCVHCGREWPGEGRVTIAYVVMLEMDDKHEKDTVHQRHERGSENNVTWCPDCKHKIFAHTSKR